MHQDCLIRQCSIVYSCYRLLLSVSKFECCSFCIALYFYLCSACVSLFLKSQEDRSIDITERKPTILLGFTMFKLRSVMSSLKDGIMAISDFGLKAAVSWFDSCGFFHGEFLILRLYFDKCELFAKSLFSLLVL